MVRRTHYSDLRPRSQLTSSVNSKIGQQMAIENSVSNDFLSTFVDSINVSDCRLSGVISLLAESYQTLFLLDSPKTFFEIKDIAAFTA